MKLINDLFEVLEMSMNDSGFSSKIKLNPHHIIYQAHFPGHPVTPGVIQWQIVHELLEEHLKQPPTLIAMSQCKFLKILNPEETEEIMINVQFNYSGESINVKAQGKTAEYIFFKLNAEYNKLK